MLPLPFAAGTPEANLVSNEGLSALQELLPYAVGVGDLISVHCKHMSNKQYFRIAHLSRRGERARLAAPSYLTSE